MALTRLFIPNLSMNIRNNFAILYPAFYSSVSAGIQVQSDLSTFLEKESFGKEKLWFCMKVNKTLYQKIARKDKDSVYLGNKN